jgi:hypothetical protein
MTFISSLLGAQMSFIFGLLGILVELEERIKPKGNNPLWVIWPIFFIRR